MEITVKNLIEQLSLEDPDAPVYFGGLDFYRVKDRGGCVQIEFNQTVDKDENSLVQVSNHEISYITAYDRDGKSERFYVRDAERDPTTDCNLIGTEYTVFTKEKPATGFTFELVNVGEDYYVKHVDNNGLPPVSGKGIVRAMLSALSGLYKKDIHSSTNIAAQKLYDSEGLVTEMQNAWKKWKNELDNVDYLADSGRYVFRYKG